MIAGLVLDHCASLTAHYGTILYCGVVYSIYFDSSGRTLNLRLEGFWTAATLVGFGAELLVRVTAIRLRHDSFAVLSDATRFPVQTPAIAQRFDRIMARGATMNTGPVAIVVGSFLNKLQAERTLLGPRLRIFLDLDEARNWLVAEQGLARV